MGEDAEIVKEFLVESYENLDRLDQNLIALEKDPQNRERLASVFRTIHTIKGTSGFLGFNQLQAVTHAGENLLAQLRDGLLLLNPEIATSLLAMVDAVRQILGSIEATGEEGERLDAELIATLNRLVEVRQQANGASPRPSVEPPQNAVPQSASKLGDILVRDGKAKASDVADAVAQQKAGDPRHLGEILVEKGAVEPRDVVDALHAQQQSRGQSVSDSTIRVDVGQLDRLMNQMGELVLLRNQIIQYASGIEDSELLSASQRLNLLTTELQEGVMKARMQPVGNVWAKFPRTVRDLALACGKRAEIEMEGKATELDKTIIEAIKDPLTHLLRNAVDHGIEPPQERQLCGKSPAGKILLRAFHEGGQVNIEIMDDGAGLDAEKIRSKAVQRGLLTSAQAAHLSERETCNLIFLPGLTTADKVTSVSGRGVGLDVVRTNIEKIGGSVEVQSKCGQGTTMRMKIPLTLAIIPALIVTSAGDRYAIPRVSLRELVRLEGEQVRKGIELVHGAAVCRLRGTLLPLIDLNRELEVGSDRTQPEAASSSTKVQKINIVVLRAAERQFGLMVDEINDTRDIVVKPLSKQLRSISVYAGATIMGDGTVALILDVLGLAQRARVIDETQPQVFAHTRESVTGASSHGSRRSMLLFRCGKDGRMAIDLSMVARLEEVGRDSIEIADGKEVVQYRGQIMPLFRVSEILQSGRADHEIGDSMQVVVYSTQGRNFGLVIDRILDIVEEEFVLDPQSRRKGVLGSAVIQKRVVDVLDLPALIASAYETGAGAPV